ncbi:MAG: phytochelatin synthase family protein [Paraperlucidibaca sp.]
MAKIRIVCAVVLSAVLLGLGGMSWFMFSTPTLHRLALAPSLIDATSVAGQQLLSRASAKTDYGQLVAEFVPQSRRGFCGVATSVAVINASSHPQPRLTQKTLFTAKASALKGELAVTFSGMTLDQMAALIAAHGLSVKTMHAAQSSLESFRAAAQRILAEPHAFLVINYDRKMLEQHGAGHISPVAAYDAETDAVLVLDVAASKYPYTWVPLPMLWAAVNTIDPDSGQTRGYLVVSMDALSKTRY